MQVADRKPPIQILTETADTVTVPRATFEALIGEIEDAEDRIAVLTFERDKSRQRLEGVENTLPD